MMLLCCLWFRNSETLVGLIHNPVELDIFSLYCKCGLDWVLYLKGKFQYLSTWVFFLMFLSIMTTGHDDILLAPLL